jgi:hypothetical protein
MKGVPLAPACLPPRLLLRPACQRKDWKRHKPACRAAVAAEVRRATQAQEATAAQVAGTGGGGAGDLHGPVVGPLEFPVGHACCGSCLAELRSKGMGQACPLCRAELHQAWIGCGKVLGWFADRHMGR